MQDSFRSLVEELGCVLCACIHDFGGSGCVVEGGREDGSEYAMEVGLRERHRDSAEVALRRDDTSLSSRRDSSLCRCWLRGRLGEVFAMDGLC